jgi:hypothetical protein
MFFLETRLIIMRNDNSNKNNAKAKTRLCSTHDKNPF